MVNYKYERSVSIPASSRGGGAGSLRWPKNVRRLLGKTAALEWC